MGCLAGVGRCFADLEIIDGIRSAVCGATRLLQGTADIVSRPVAEGQSVRVCGADTPTRLPKGTADIVSRPVAEGQPVRVCSADEALSDSRFAAENADNACKSSSGYSLSAKNAAQEQLFFELHARFRKDLACGFYQHGYTAHGQNPLVGI